MKTIAIYPGTFDPITNGHIDLARRATAIFDQIVIGISTIRDDSRLLDAQTRVELARETVSDQKNIKVFGFDGLLVDFAKQHNAQVILRGLRAVSDFEYEFRLAGMNRQLEKNLESVFLTPADEYTFISSSLIREIALLGGNISKFVPASVAKTLEKKCKQLHEFNKE